MNQHSSRLSKLWRRALALMLTALLVVGTVSSVSAAEKSDPESADTDSAVQEMIKKGSKNYPKGAFGLFNTMINMTEGDQDSKITVVRMGSAKGEATVEFHALDVSSKYGDDYELYMKDGWFGSERKLEAAEGSRSLMDSYGDKLTTVDDKDLEAENNSEDKTDKTTTVTTESKDGLSELQKAQVAQTGTLNKTKTWREIADEKSDEYKDADKAMKNGAKNVQKMINQLGGVCEKLTFADGETTKEIFVRVPDDETSDGEVQAMFALTNASTEVSDASDGYINIKDNEKSEEAKYAFLNKDISVRADKDSVEVTLVKTAGTEAMSVVNLMTTDGTAKEGANYDAVSETLIFPKGLKEKSVSIPLKANPIKEKLNFYIGVANEKGKVDRDKGLAKITLLPSKAKASTGANISKSATGETSNTYNKDSLEITFDKWDCHCSYDKRHAYADDKGDYTYDLRNAKKISYMRLVDWGNGNQHWQVKLILSNGSHILLGERFNSPTETISPSKRVRWNENNIYQDVNALFVHTFTDSERKLLNKYGKQTYFYVWIHDEPGWGAEDWGNNNLTYAKVEYNKITLKPDAADEYNKYRPVLYDSKQSGGKKLESGIFLTDINYTNSNENFVRNPNYGRGVQVDKVKFDITPADNKTSTGVQPKSELYNFEGLYARVNETRIKFRYTQNYGSDADDIFNTLEDKTTSDTITIVPKVTPKETTVKFINVDGVQFNDRANNSQLSCKLLDSVKLYASPTRKDVAVNGFKATVNGKEIPVELDEGKLDSGTLKFTGDCAGKTVEVRPVCGKTTLTVMPYPVGGNSRNLDKGTVSYVPASGDMTKVVSADKGGTLEVPETVIGGTYTIVGVGHDGKNKSEFDKDNDPNQYIAAWWDGSADTNGDGDFSKAELENYYGKGVKEPPIFVGTAYDFEILKSGPKKIYYKFNVVNGKNGDRGTKDAVTVHGNTILKEKKIFPISTSRKTSETPLNGASVSGAGDTAVSGINPKDPEDEGWFELWSNFLDSSQRYLVQGNYLLGDSTLNASLVGHPNVQYDLVFDINSVMDITGGGLQIYDTGLHYENGVLKKTEAKWKKIEDMTSLYNDDEKYKLTVNIESSETSRLPKKARLFFYDADGKPIEDSSKSGTADTRLQIEKEIKVTDNGEASFEFNPHSLNLAKGTQLYVQVEDQLGTKYPVMRTGYKVYEAIGEQNLRSTFSFGGAFAAVKVIGLIQGKNGTSWNGELNPNKTDNVVAQTIELTAEEEDQLDTEKLILKKKADAGDEAAKAAIERIEEQLDDNEMKTLTLTLGVSKDDIYEKESKTEDTFAKSVEDKSDADIALVKAADEYAKSSGDADAKKKYEDAQKKAEDAKIAYQEALDKKAHEKGTKTEFSKSLKMGLGFTYVVSFKYDEAVENWYFDMMMMTITAKGELNLRWNFATPIGVTITLGIDIGGQFDASVIFRDKVDSKKFYLNTEDKSSLQKDNDGAINIFALASDGEYVKTSGMFNIKPSITLSAEASAGPLKVKASGTADFDMKFYTPKEIKNTGTVSLSAEISVTVFGIGGSWEFKTDPIQLFGADAESIDDQLGLDGDDTKMFGASDRFTAEDTSYADKRKGWQGMNPASAKSLDENPNGVVEQKLQEKVYAQAKVDIHKINENGDYLGVFTDIDKNREGDLNKPAVFYSVYDGEKGTWSKPEIIEKDGTGDQDVKVTDLGDRGLFVYWNSYSEKVSDDIAKTDLMNKLELRGAFFDKAQKKFVEKDGKTDIVEITKDTDEVYGDINASVAVNNKTMLVYYTKNYYAVSNAKDGELVGDVVHPDATYQVFRTYNFTGDKGTDGAFVDNFDNLTDKTIAQEIKDNVEDYDSYVKSYYGQVFLNTAPNIYVEEKMDETGRFWAEEPKVYSGSKVTTVKTKNSSDSASIVGEETEIKGDTVKANSVPYIVDYDSISYNDLGIFAYSVDYDNDLTTVKDRDVFFQLYDFETGIMSHPVVVTSDNVQDTDVHLSRQSYTDKDGKSHAATLLSWIQDGTIVSLDISNVIKNLGEPKTDDNGTKYYLIEKTEKAGYVPPQGIASHKPEDDDAHLEEEEMTAEEKAQAAPEITSFDIYCTDGYNYYVWTDRENKVVEGVDEHSNEASEAKNRVLETQIYMVRNDLVNEVLTDSVQVTSEEGANYENARFVVNKDGTLKALARKAGSKVVDYKEFNNNIEENNKLLPKDEQEEKVEKENFAPYNDVTDEKDLVSLDITPVSVAKLRNTDDILKDVYAGGATAFDITVLNDGIDTLDELTVTAVDKDGNGILTERKYGGDEAKAENNDTSASDKLVKSVKLTDIYGGSVNKISAQLNTKDTDDSAKVTITLTGKDDKVIDTKTVEKKFESRLELSDLEVEKTAIRDSFNLSLKAKNTGSKQSAEKALEIGTVDKDGKDVKLAETTLEAIAVNDEIDLTPEAVQADSAKYFTETKDENGNITETGTFYVTDGTARAEGKVTRTATAEQAKAVESFKAVTVNGGDSVSAAKDEKVFADILLDGKPVSDTPGLRTILESSDESIFGVDNLGTIEAYKIGNAKLTVKVLPANSKSVAEFNGTEGESVIGSHTVDNYADVPTSLIRTFETNVNITETSVEPTVEPTSPTEEPTVEPTVEPTSPTEEPTEPAKAVTSVKKGGVTYKVSGKNAAAVKYNKKTKKVTIPATVKIDGKSYKVTKINANVFKNSKKLTTVKIGKNVTSIGKSAFYGCKKLKKITIPKAVTKIGAKAFYGCKALKKITFKSKKAPTIGKYAFKGINKKAVFTVPKSSMKKYAKKLVKKAGVTAKMTIKKG